MSSQKKGFSLVDTHCHIHDAAFSDKFEGKDPDVLVAEASEAGVTKLVCVGTDLHSSRQAIAFCKTRENCYATLALHPHEAASMSEAEIDAAIAQLDAIATAQPTRLVGIGETGLDYFYHDNEQTRARQAYLLRRHIELAQKHDVPMVFHIREAFGDFFEIFDEYKGVRGVVHSFTATETELAGVLQRGLYVGLNGIMTFTKFQKQTAAAKAVPLEKIVVETDAPFLTPVPFRGKMCEPKHMVHTAEFLATLRGESLQQFAKATTQNAHTLFGL